MIYRSIVLLLALLVSACVAAPPREPGAQDPLLCAQDPPKPPIDGGLGGTGKYPDRCP